MKIAHLGATGYVGSRVLEEALHRGHEVTVLARNAHTLAARPRLHTLALDLHERSALLDALLDHDALIVTVKSRNFAPHTLIDLLNASGIPRTLVVGGAGSLRTAGGQDLVDTADFPAQWKPEALAARALLQALRDEYELDWRFLSPAAQLMPGARTGTFRLGADELLCDVQGESRISLEDLAVAVLDEIETPRHTRQRFTLAY
ncbi:MAG: NAD-dependent epimerase/dehydratase [Rhodocyclales bacterium]|nr:NAD-dependent epimerase/dehydratase [Rhodocyclales bacterium]